VKDSFYEELERVIDKLPKYHTKILLGDFNAKVGRGDIFKLTIGNGSLHEISNDNGVRSVNLATSKNLGVKSTMFPHRNIYKYIWMFPDGKPHNQIGHILVDRRKHSNVLDVRSFRAAYCDSDHYLLVAKVEERLAVNKQRSQRFNLERFNLKKLNDVEGKEQYLVEVSNRFAVLEDLDTEVEINSAWETIRGNIKISAKESLNYFEMKMHKPWFNEGRSELLDQRKQAKLQWLQDPSEINGDNPNIVRREARRHFRNKKREYLKEKINELATNSKNKNIRDLYRGIIEIKRGYQPRNNLVKYKNGYLLVDSHNILNRWKNYFCQLLNVHNVSDVRQIEEYTAEPLVPGPSRLQRETTIAKLKKYKSPGSDQIPAKNDSSRR
jgi:hypothetical protein